MKGSGKPHIEISSAEKPLPATPPVLGAREEERLVSGERLRLVVLGAFTVLFIVLCAFLAAPFLPALTWGVALAIVAWPLHVWISRHVRWPNFAATISLTIVVLVIVVPGIFVAYQLVQEAGSAANRMQAEHAHGAFRAALEKVPALQPTVAWMDHMSFDVDEAVRKVIKSITGDIDGLIQGSLMALIQFAIALFILFHLLRDRPLIVQRVRALLPLSSGEADRVFSRVSDSVHATINGQVVTGVIDGVTGGLLFWALGLPSPVLWGVVMTVLSIMPALGTFLIWGPATAYLFLSGNIGGGLILIAWGVTTAIFIDNLFYSRLAGGRMRLHAVPTLLSLLGGLAVFGMSGIIIGPVIVVTTIVLIEVWGHRSTEQTTDTLVKRLETAADEPIEALAESDAKADSPEADALARRMEQASIGVDKVNIIDQEKSVGPKNSGRAHSRK